MKSFVAQEYMWLLKPGKRIMSSNIASQRPLSYQQQLILDILRKNGALTQRGNAILSGEYIVCYVVTMEALQRKGYVKQEEGGTWIECTPETD